MNKLFLKYGSKNILTTVNQKNDVVAAFRYIKSSMLKSKRIHIEDDIIKELNFKRKTCPFCGNPSYVIYNMHLHQNTVCINSINYSKIQEYDNYHCKGGKLKCKGSLLNPNSINYIKTSCNVSESIARDILHSRNKSPFYRCNHESDESYKKTQAKGLEWYEKKFGKEGKMLYDNKLKMISLHSKHEFFIQKYGESVANDIKAKKAITLTNMVERYGECDGILRYNSWLNKIKRTKENFVQKYGESIGNEKYNIFVKKRAYRNTKQYFFDMFGYDLGLIKYKDWIESISFNKEKHIAKYGEESWIARQSNNYTQFSKESQLFIELLIDKLTKEELILTKIKHGNAEFYQYDKEMRKIYFYDLHFMIDTKSIIIEYDTPFCHPNKNYMTIDEYNKWEFPFNGITPDEKFNYDEQKKLLAEKNGHYVFTAYIKTANCIEKQLDELTQKIKMLC